MKILAISYLFPNSEYPNYGIFVLNRLKAVQKYHEIKVVNPIPWFPFSNRFKRYRNFNRIPFKETINGIPVYHPRFFIVPGIFTFIHAFTFLLAVFPLCLRLKKRYLFEIIDLHWTYPDLLTGFILAKFFKLKHLVTVRGKEALLWNFKNEIYKKEASIRALILKQLICRVDFLIVLSNELKSLCVSTGVSSQKIAVIPNGVDHCIFFYKDKENCRIKLGLRKDQKIILMVGALIYGKGFDRVLKIFPEVLKAYPDCVLKIIGSEGPAGDYRDELNELVIKHNLEKKVDFIGQVKNHDLVLWYNAADLFCLPSRSEGSPNVLSEALACGCPSVATNVGSVSEILTEKKMGIITEIEKGQLLLDILFCIGNDFDRKKISKSMHQYNWDWCAQRVNKIYRQLS